MSLDRRRLIGSRGEEIALEYLRNKGYRLLAKNYRCRLGEIDLIMAEGATLIFIEVKTRNSHCYGLPQEAVDYRKQTKLRYLAESYLNSCHSEENSVRFDVVAITIYGESHRIEHLEGVF